MKYGILFHHPLNDKRGYKSVLPNGGKYENWFVNIEVRDDNFSTEQVLDFLNKHWNSTSKLFKLQECGNVIKLGTTVSNSVTELSCFKDKHSGVKKYVDECSGDIDYLTKDTDGFSTAVLEVPMCMCKDIESALKEVYEYEWEYIFILNDKTFTVIEVDG